MLIFTEGFEDDLHAVGLGKWVSSGWNGISDTYGRNGRGGWNDSGSTVGTNLDPEHEHDTLVVGFAYRTTGASNGGTAWMGFFSDAGATQHVRWGWNQNTLDMVLSYGPISAGVIYQMLPDVWYYVEVKARLHDTFGFVEVRINGVTVYSATNVDTKNGGTKTVFDHVRFNTGVISPSRRHGHFDDIYILNGAGLVNNDFLGDISIETLFPDGNGDESDFQGSDGNSVDNYLLVDEQAYSMADWAGGDAVGERDLYTVQNPVRTVGRVLGAIVYGVIQNGDSGPRGMGLVMKKGTTLTTPVNVALSTTPQVTRKIIDVDIVTGAEMTIPDVQALQIGAEITT